MNGLLGEWPSYLREMWGRQSINLQPKGCDTVGVSVHELGHALGLAHEHKRSDRGDHVKINWKNIKSSWKAQFKVDERASVRLPYDYQSVMHYPMFNKSIAKNRRLPLMTPVNCKGNCPTSLSQRVGLSKLDHKKLGEMYKCKSTKMATWINSRTCIDSPSFKGKCKKYKNNWGCYRDPKPCCACGRFNSGWMVRTYRKKVIKKIKNCKDKQEKQICRQLKNNGLCWAKDTKK